MTQDRLAGWDAFLRELAAQEAQEAHSANHPNNANNANNGASSQDALRTLEQLAESLEPVSPDAQVRARLMASAQPAGRLSRFAEQVASLLDLSLEKAKALIDRLDDPKDWAPELPGISFLWVDGGPAVAGAVRGFLRVQAGVEFPEHEHFGEERVLIMQGAYQDSVSGKLWTPGEIAVMEPGSAHAFRVPAGGPDLLKLSVVQKGLRVGPQTYTPR